MRQTDRVFQTENAQYPMHNTPLYPTNTEDNLVDVFKNC